MKLIIYRQAEDELAEAIAYYDQIDSSLGIRLKHEVRAKLEWIRENPCVVPLRNPGYRRVNCKTFPYFIGYSIVDEVIHIQAIMHAKRRPDTWVKRKP